MLDRDRSNHFADCSEDHHFTHVEPEAARTTPFGGTITRGFLIVSILAAMIE